MMGFTPRFCNFDGKNRKCFFFSPGRDCETCEMQFGDVQKTIYLKIGRCVFSQGFQLKLLWVVVLFSDVKGTNIQNAFLFGPERGCETCEMQLGYSESMMF